MVLRLLLISVFAGFVHLRSIPAPSPLLQKAPHSIDFLKKYGYLPGPSYNGQLDTRMSVLEELFTKDAVENAIKQAQRFGGLTETGELDDDTVKLFSSKRCGVPDIIRNASSSVPDNYRDEAANHHSTRQHHHHGHHRKKRFVLNGAGWKKRHLKFAFRNWAGTLSQSEVEQETEKALGVWANYGRLKFTRTNNPNDADITIGFYRGQHGDINPFDGKGNVLAHAYFPVPYAGRGLAGDVHFDDDETWSVGQTDARNAVDYTTVALHELGHSLGLSHSHERGSVMNPYYKGTHSLGDDDIRAMYELYASQPLEYPGQDIDEQGDNFDEQKRKYDQHRREWEKKQEEERRRQEEEEERNQRENKRKEEERIYEEKKKKYEEDRKRHEERLHAEAERRKMEEKRDEEIRKRLEEESRRHEEERQKWNERVTEEKKRYEEAMRRQEAAQRAEYERKKYEEDRRREPNKAGAGDSSSKSGRYPNGTTFEGDFETVDHHKQHDSTHQIPAKQGNQDIQSDQKPSRSTNTFDENDGCVGSFDTAAYLRGEIFITKGTMLWRLSRPGAVQRGYPTEVHTFFHLLPKNVKRIDAMYQRDRDQSFIIFSGRQFWVFDGWKFVEGSPRSIQDYGLPNDVGRVDAATSRNNEVLLFSGDRYWSFNDTISLQPLQKPAAQPISRLRGLPDSLDAALTYNDVLYFFKDDRFWYLDRKTLSPVLHRVPASEYWIAC